MPKRPCLRCGALAHGSYCPAHRPEGRQSHGRRGSTRAWRALRAEAMLRDGHRCRACGSEGPLEVHHGVSLAEGGSGGLENLETLCEDCHSAAHGPPEAA